MGIINYLCLEFNSQFAFIFKSFQKLILEIMNDPELMKSIRRGLRGKGVKLEEFALTPSAKKALKEARATPLKDYTHQRVKKLVKS